MSEQTARSKPTRASSWLGTLVRLLVLLALAGIGAVGYFYAWPEVKAFQAKQAEVEQNLAALAKADEALAKNLAKLIDTEVQKSEDATTAALQSAVTRLSKELDSIRGIEQRAAGKLNEANHLLYRMSKVDQGAWRRAEAHFNIRLASQRLQFAGDVSGALNLLSQADVLLKGDSSDGVSAIRSAIAFDRTQLRAAEKLDMVGLMGRLSALDRQIQMLDLKAFDPSVRHVASDTSTNIDTDVSSSERSASLTLLEQALDTLASYFVISELDSPEQKPRTSDWSGFAVLSTKLHIEQARVALLIRNSESFTRSLERALGLLEEIPSSNGDPSLSSVREELADLSAIPLRLELPALESLKLVSDESGGRGDAEDPSALFNAQSSDQVPAGAPE
ncbi:MAG: uroporphyrinogen-III C-methyltransferase [Halieaceae bacterium]